jgi:hypothetical protein
VEPGDAGAGMEIPAANAADWKLAPARTASAIVVVVSEVQRVRLPIIAPRAPSDGPVRQVVGLLAALDGCRFVGETPASTAKLNRVSPSLARRA